MATVESASSRSQAQLMAREVLDYVSQKVDEKKLAADLGDYVKAGGSPADVRTAINDLRNKAALQRALDYVVGRDVFLKDRFSDINDSARLEELGPFRPKTAVPEQRAPSEEQNARDRGAKVRGEDIHAGFTKDGPAVQKRVGKPTAKSKAAAKADGNEAGDPSQIAPQANASSASAPAAAPAKDPGKVTKAAKGAAKPVVAKAANDTPADPTAPETVVDGAAPIAAADAEPVAPAPVLEPQAVGEINPDPNKAPLGDTIAQPKADGSMPTPGEFARRMLDGIQARLDGKPSELDQHYAQRVAQRNAMQEELVGARAAVADINKKDKAARTPDDDRLVAQLPNMEKDFAELNAHVTAESRAVQNVGGTLGELQASLYGLRTARYRDKTASLDEGSKLHLAVVSRMMGSDDGGVLPPDMAKEIDDWRANPANAEPVSKFEDRIKMVEMMAQRASASNIPPTDAKIMDDKVTDALREYAMTGNADARYKAIDAIETVREKLGLAPEELAAQQAQAQARAQQAAGPKAPATADAKDDGKDNTFVGFGLSKPRRAELNALKQEELVQSIDQYHETLKSYYLKSASRLSSMQAILHSNMPIEAMLVMFMALMTENEEDKLKLKMMETTVAEGFERANRKIETDRNWARDLLKKYRADGVGLPAEYRGKLKVEELSAMAGEHMVDKGLSEPEAADIRAKARADEARLWGEPPDPSLTPKELEDQRLINSKEVLEARKKQGPTDPTYEYVDMQLIPMNYGFSNKSSSTLTQEMQAQAQAYKQMIETFTSVLRMLQDMVNKIVTNIR